MKTILSLCDYSGTWSQPYQDNGYHVIRVDLKHGQDVRLLEWQPFEIHGILCAPPCTEFSASGAQYWKAKDKDGRTLSALAVADACARAVALYNPTWWVLENPVGRLRDWYGPPRFCFNPCDFGGYMEEGERSCEVSPERDAYTKCTLLWGRFNVPSLQPVKPVRANAQGSWIQSLPGQSERTKELRSVTPIGFSRAFFEANP